MGKGATRIIVYSLAGILLSGVGAPIAQAAPQSRDDRQRQEQQRRERQRPTPPRENSREWQNRNNHHRNNDGRRHVYNNERYRASHWRESSHIYERRQPWFWHSRDHAGRHRIIDVRWDREFPGLRSYRWHGPDFWYRGIEYRDLVMFYDDGDMLVSIGFWDQGRFIMIRDDNRSYYNTSPFVLGYRDHNIQIRMMLRP